MSDPRLLQGVGVSAGLAIGPVRMIAADLPTVTRRVVAPGQVNGEIERLHVSLAAVKELLRVVYRGDWHTEVQPALKQAKSAVAKVEGGMGRSL